MQNFKDFIIKHGIEFHWHKNNEKNDVVIFIEFNNLESFRKLIGINILDEEGLECTMKDGYVCFWMDYILEHHNVELTDVFEEGVSWEDFHNGLYVERNEPITFKGWYYFSNPILTDALHHWGHEVQIDKSIEEMSELIKALIKHRHKEINDFTIPAVCEEISDVEIMLQQLRLIFDRRKQYYSNKEVRYNFLIEEMKVQKLILLKNKLATDGKF